MFLNFFVVIFLFSSAYAAFPELSSFDQNFSASPAEDSPVPKYRLSKDLEPVSYELHVKTYVPGYIQFDEAKNFTFDGQVVITFKVLNETDKIELFSKNLKLNEPKLSHPSEPEELRIEKTDPQSDTDKVVFNVNKNMTVKDEYILEITYSGLMPLDGDIGLYSQAYSDKHGNIHYLASTQNEPFGARLILPCFDEPQFKAVWNVSIVHPRGTTALSNAMEIQEDEIGNDWIQTSFDKTPQMSSYLLAMAIVNYKYKEKTIESTSGNTIRGASAIRTIELVMGSRDFYEGIKLYLNRYHFGNVDYHDLLNTLSEIKHLNESHGSPKSVAEFAETWILQSGYPIVTVKRHNFTHVELTQKPRFEDQSTKAKWWIPIFYKVNDDSKPMEWLFDPLYLEVKQDDVLLLNEDLNVLYCINHDGETLNAIKDKVGDKEIFPWPSLQKFIENSIIAADLNCASYDSVLELLAEVFKHRLDDLKAHFAVVEAGQKLDKKGHFTKSFTNRGYYQNFEEIDSSGSIVNFMRGDHHQNYVSERQRY